jgi:hypothetical protein
VQAAAAGRMQAEDHDRDDDGHYRVAEGLKAAAAHLRQAFAERARIELRATAEHASKRTVGMTPQNKSSTGRVIEPSMSSRVGASSQKI